MTGSMAQPRERDRIETLGVAVPGGSRKVTRWTAPSLAVLALACASPPDVDVPTTPSAEPSADAEARRDPPGSALAADLEDPKKREAAIAALIEEYDEAAKNGLKTKRALAFVEAHGAMLTRVYVEHHDALSPKTRLALVNLLVSFQDPVTAPALAAAIMTYARSQEGVDEAIWACQAAKKLRADALRPALLAAFNTVELSDEDGRRFSNHLEQAMIFNATEAWVSELRNKLARPIVRPERFDDKQAVREFNNQRFWQITAAKILGELRDAGSVRTLLTVTLDPEKRDVQPQASRALMNIGRPTVDVAHSLLRGEDEELVRLAKQADPETREAHVLLAAKLLQELAHPSSQAPLLDAWGKARTLEAQVMLSRAATRTSNSDRATRALKQTYARTRWQTTLPNGEGALEALARAAVFFFDPELAEWMGTRISKVPGKGARLADVQRTLVVGASELMLESQIETLNTPAQRYGGRIGTPAFDAAAKLARRCGNKASCYAAAVTEAGSQAEDRAGVTLKAATMVGVLGKPEHRDGLLKSLGEIKHPRVAERVAEVIAHMTQQYEQNVVGALEARIKGEKEQALVLAFSKAAQRIRARR